MKNYLLIFASIFLFPYSFYSQVPGYMGHKFQVQVELGTLPNFNGALFKEYSSNFSTTNNFTFNSSLGLLLGYSISRKYNFVASFSHKKRNVYFPYVSASPFYTNSNDLRQLFYVQNGEAVVINNKLSIGLQKYRGDGIAPVGKYIEFGFALNTASLYEDESLMQVDSLAMIYLDDYTHYNIDAPKVVSDAELVKLATLYFGFGKKRVFNNKMFLDVKFKFYMPLSFKDGSNTDRTYDDLMIDSEVYEPHYFKVGSYSANKYLKDRLRRFQLHNEIFELKIAIGYIF